MCKDNAKVEDQSKEVATGEAKAKPMEHAQFVNCIAFLSKGAGLVDMQPQIVDMVLRTAALVKAKGLEASIKDMDEVVDGLAADYKQPEGK